MKDIKTDIDLIEAIDALCHHLKAGQPHSDFRSEFQTMVDQFISKYELDSDPHAFASPSRCARSIVWLDANDCDPPHGLDMLWTHDSDKVNYLEQQFMEHGFDLNAPALIGYPLKGRIQLLSGTHRHLAAKQANIKLPVSLWLRSDIEEMWGTELWGNVLADIPVQELMDYFVKEGVSRSPYPAVDMEEIDALAVVEV